MNKYTTFKAFEKKFPFQIWKIVVDVSSKQIGVELRDSDSTLPILYILDFEGKEILQHKQLDEKEWTLEALQHDTLILKRVGDTLPVKEGILFLDREGNERRLWQEYIWLDTFPDTIQARHRNLQSGFEEYIDIRTLQKVTAKTIQQGYDESIKMPIPYHGTRPAYLQHIRIEDLPWISRAGDYILWSYHTKENTSYNLNLCITDKSNIIYTQRLLANMPKMIPQPYFQVANQIFLMSYNKREIVSYLV